MMSMAICMLQILNTELVGECLLGKFTMLRRTGGHCSGIDKHLALCKRSGGCLAALCHRNADDRTWDQSCKKAWQKHL